VAPFRFFSLFSLPISRLKKRDFGKKLGGRRREVVGASSFPACVYGKRILRIRAEFCKSRSGLRFAVLQLKTAGRTPLFRSAAGH
jgi:hypothetical protein